MADVEKVLRRVSLAFSQLSAMVAELEVALEERAAECEAARSAALESVREVERFDEVDGSSALNG